MILTLFALPLLLMSTIYIRIFLMISRHQEGRRLNLERSTLSRGIMSVTGTGAAVNFPELVARSSANKCAICEARDIYQDQREGNEVVEESLDNVSGQRQLNRPLGSVSNWSRSSISRDSYTFDTIALKSRPTDSTETATTKGGSSGSMHSSSGSGSSGSLRSSVDDDELAQRETPNSNSDQTPDVEIRGRSVKRTSSRRSKGRKVSKKSAEKGPTDCDEDDLSAQEAPSRRELIPLMKTEVSDKTALKSKPGGAERATPRLTEGEQISGEASGASCQKALTSGGKPALKTVSVVEATPLMDAPTSRSGSCRQAQGVRVKKILRAQFSLGGGSQSVAKGVRLLIQPSVAGGDGDHQASHDKLSRRAAPGGSYTLQSAAATGTDAEATIISSASSAAAAKVALSQSTSIDHNSQPRKGCTCDNKLTTDPSAGNQSRVGKLLSRSHTIAADNNDDGAPKGTCPPRPSGKAAALLTMTGGQQLLAQGSSISASTLAVAGARGGLSSSLKIKLRLSSGGGATSCTSDNGADSDKSGGRSKRKMKRHRRHHHLQQPQVDQRSNIVATDYSATSSTYEPQRRHIHASAVPQTNTKALVTTLLILGTYFISYVPAIIYQVLTCIDSCPYPLYDVSFSTRVLLGAMTTLLLIAKSIIDPFIYSCRMSEIQVAISRYFTKRRSKTSSLATSLHTSQRFMAGTNLSASNNNTNNHHLNYPNNVNNHQHQSHSHQGYKQHDFNTSSQARDSLKILNTGQTFRKQANDQGSKLVVYSYRESPETNSEETRNVDDNDTSRGDQMGTKTQLGKRRQQDGLVEEIQLDEPTESNSKLSGSGIGSRSSDATVICNGNLVTKLDKINRTN